MEGDGESSLCFSFGQTHDAFERLAWNGSLDLDVSFFPPQVSAVASFPTLPEHVTVALSFAEMAGSLMSK